MAMNGTKTTPYLLLVNGPNLNRLGTREPSIYGYDTLHDVEARVAALAAAHNVAVCSHQSNHEGDLIDYLQSHGPQSIGVILNPGAFAHYGLALRDCVADIGCPVVEVHISNVHQREPFRHQLVLAPVVTGQMVGFGTTGYELAAQYLISQYLNASQEGNS
jgi:3-dehydroquinate dehydratase II